MSLMHTRLLLTRIRSFSKSTIVQLRPFRGTLQTSLDHSHLPTNESKVLVGVFRESCEALFALTSKMTMVPFTTSNYPIRIMFLMRQPGCCHPSTGHKSLMITNPIQEALGVPHMKIALYCIGNNVRHARPSCSISPTSQPFALPQNSTSSLHFVPHALMHVLKIPLHILSSMIMTLMTNQCPNKQTSVRRGEQPQIIDTCTTFGKKQTNHQEHAISTWTALRFTTQMNQQRPANQQNNHKLCCHNFCVFITSWVICPSQK